MVSKFSNATWRYLRRSSGTSYKLHPQDEMTRSLRHTFVRGFLRGGNWLFVLRPLNEEGLILTFKTFEKLMVQIYHQGVVM